MNSVNSIGANDPVQRVVNNPINKSIPSDTTAATSLPTAADRLELSGMNYLLQGGDVRADKVASVRAQIEAGTYETDDKLNTAADKLLDDLNN
jgi:anti-sigma28 factor (negative regulator of flagellin synthesis)